MRSLLKYAKSILQRFYKSQSTELHKEPAMQPPVETDIGTSFEVDSPFRIPHIYGHIFSDDSVISHQTAGMIRYLLTKDYRKTAWLSLSESYRYLHMPDHRYITKSDIQRIFLNFSEEEAAHLIGIASMNANGYLRENALVCLKNFTTPEVIPYLLLRLNDWVPIVRLIALEIFQSKLINFHPIELIKNFNLIKWLTTIQRTNLKDLQNRIFLHISQNQFKEEVLIYLNKATVKENLFYWKTLKEELGKSPDLLDKLLNRGHPEVKQWAIEYLPKDSSHMTYLEKLCKDKASRVRYAALRSIPGELQQKYKMLFHQALVSPTRKSREYSRFVLSKLEPQDFKKFYQEKLGDRHQSTNIGTILGWIEVSQPEDRELILKFLNDSSCKVRESAFQAIVRLELAKTPEYYLSGMIDPNSKVRRICTQNLKKMVGCIQEEMKRLLINKSPAIQRAALEVLSAQPPPQTLESILYALNLHEKSLDNIAWEYLHKWHSEYSIRPYFSIDSELYEKIMHLYQKIDRETEVPLGRQTLWRGRSGLPVLLKLLRPK